MLNLLDIPWTPLKEFGYNAFLISNTLSTAMAPNMSLQQIFVQIRHLTCQSDLLLHEAIEEA